MSLPSPPEQCVEKCHVGVCCSAGDSVEPCLNSLKKSGWIGAVRVFLAPGAIVPRRYGDLPVTCLPQELDWAARDLLVLGEMLMRAPEAMAYLITGANVILGRPNCRREVEALLEADGNPGMILLESDEGGAGERSSQLANEPSQPPKAVVITREAARGFLSDRSVLDAAAARCAAAYAPGNTLQAWAVDTGLPIHALDEEQVRTAQELAPDPSEEHHTLRVSGAELSIIVPTWNCAPYLRPCLRSLLSQTVNAEIIVVDDASDDETGEILAEFDDRVRVLQHDEQRGANAARNTGLRLATGDFVVMADADNQYSPTWLEKLFEVALSDPEIGVAYCGFSRLSEDGSRQLFASRPWNLDTLWYGNYIDMPSLVRREALPGRGLVEGFRPFDDWRLWLDMATRGWKGKRVGEDLYVKRIRKDSKTLRSKSMPADRAREVASLRREFAHLVGLDHPVSVVIPAYGCEDLTVRCLTHLADFSGVPFVVNYVDNGSPISVLDTVARRAEQCSISLRILRNSENLGFTPAVNQGLAASAGSNVLVLNNDCFVGPNCLEILAYEMATRECVAAIGPVTNDQGAQSLLLAEHRSEARVGEGILDVLSDPAQTAIHLRKQHKTCEREILAFFCTLLNGEALRRFGHLDDRFPSGLGADDEWCLRVRGHGWRTLLSYGAYAAHMHRSTFDRCDIDRDAMQQESQDVLRQVLAENQENEV
jgi:glycosyltransferase involved in cell wall biosynthesis